MNLILWFMVNRGKAIMIVLTSMFFILFALSILNQNYLISTFEGKLSTWGLGGLFFISLILEALPQYIAPQLFAFSAAILSFPFFSTVFALYLGSAVGSIIAFEVGYYYRNPLSQSFFSDSTVGKIKKGINGRGRAYILISSVCPIPFIPFIFGFLHLERRNFLLLGVLPRFFYFLYVGMIAFYFF
jgi:membrane protein YqaA with SNARE-associated domain